MSSHSLSNSFLNLAGRLRYAFFGLCASLLFLSGCSTVYKGTGDVMVNFADDVAVPYLLKTDDIRMACSMSEAFAPFMFSFEDVTASPDSLKIVLYMMAGQCVQQVALEAQLDYLQAVKQSNGLKANDARIRQKRYLSLAASRYYLGYQSMIAAYGEPGGSCPALKEHNEQMYWLSGLLNGLQALFADMGSEGSQEIPMDIAAKVSRSAECLNNERWWGMPRAIQGAVWSMIPGSGPEGTDPSRVLSDALEVGERRRVRLAHVLAAEVYLSKGNRAKVKEIIRRNAQQTQEKPADPMAKMFDQVARNHLLGISDQLWSSAVGHRTPWLGYGTFWDDKNEEDEVLDLDIDDLL